MPLTHKIPDLTNLDPESLIVLRDCQLAAMSTVPANSIPHYRDTGVLVAAVPGANCYKVKDVKAFCFSRIQLTSNRLVHALRAQNPRMTTADLAAEAASQLAAMTPKIVSE